MASSVVIPNPLNPNAYPFLNSLPHQIIQTPSFDLPPVIPVVPYYPVTAVVPYYPPPETVVPVYHFYPVTQVVVPVQPTPQCVAHSGFSGCRSRNFGWKKRGFNTTVMIRNIPNQFRRYMLVDFLDQVCYDENARYNFQPPRFAYDFLYLPMDFKRGNNLGYAFVNFTSSYAAGKIRHLLGGYKWGVFEDSYGENCKSDKICEINWAAIQGKNDLVKHFRNSNFPCNNIEYLPVLFSPPRDGATAPFPPTTVGKLGMSLYNESPRLSLSLSSLAISGNA